MSELDTFVNGKLKVGLPEVGHVCDWSGQDTGLSLVGSELEEETNIRERSVINQVPAILDCYRRLTAPKSDIEGSLPGWLMWTRGLVFWADSWRF